MELCRTTYVCKTIYIYTYIYYIYIYPTPEPRATTYRVAGFQAAGMVLALRQCAHIQPPTIVDHTYEESPLKDSGGIYTVSQTGNSNLAQPVVAPLSGNAEGVSLPPPGRHLIRLKGHSVPPLYTCRTIKKSEHVFPASAMSKTSSSTTRQPRH